MQNKFNWVLVDTETNGLAEPIYVVEIAAQRMSGWEPDGEPFLAMLNQNAEIPPEVSRIHGYTREILERDGLLAQDAYGILRKYVKDLPIVSYNLEFDLDRVLLPEWNRLGLAPIGSRGFCALRLTQRLLDPVPAGNCKLQTLRQFYRLPERGAHSALGDILTVIDLIRKVLQPISQERGLDSWQAVVKFTEEEWFPTRLAFGKYKGRSFKDAAHDQQFKEWLLWLTKSKNERTARIGKWYLARLYELDQQVGVSFTAATAVDLNTKTDPKNGPRTGIIVFHNIEIEEIRFLVTAARERLADLEVIYARDCNAVAVIQSQLFSLLQDSYRKRDNLKLVIDYRKRFLDGIVRLGEEESEQISREYQKARHETETQYKEAAEIASSQKKLSEDQQAELKGIFRKLLKLFHPDRYINNPETYQKYTRLMQEVNIARQNGDIEKLREISNDPEGYARKIGVGQIDLSEESQLDNLKRLYESLQAQIIEMLELINELRADPKYELTQLAARRPEYLHEIATEYEKQIDAECVLLCRESEELAQAIFELTGTYPSSIDL